MLSRASPTVSVVPRAVEDAEELERGAGGTRRAEEAHPARAIAAAAARRKPLFFLVMIWLLFMIRSFGRWVRTSMREAMYRDHGLAVSDKQVGDQQVGCRSAGRSGTAPGPQVSALPLVADDEAGESIRRAGYRDALPLPAGEPAGSRLPRRAGPTRSSIWATRSRRWRPAISPHLQRLAQRWPRWPVQRAVGALEHHLQVFSAGAALGRVARVMSWPANECRR